MDYIIQKRKTVYELNDTDLSELAQKFNLGPHQIAQKAKRLYKE
jgi:hypothetical protein